MRDTNTTNALSGRVEQAGFAIVPTCLDEATVELLSKQFDETRYPGRNLLSLQSVRALAISQPVREIMQNLDEGLLKRELRNRRAFLRFS